MMAMTSVTRFSSLSFILAFFAAGVQDSWASAVSFQDSSPDWSEGVSVPYGGRANPYQLSASEFVAARRRGLEIALTYPVPVTGALVPYRPFKEALNTLDSHPFRRFALSLFRGFRDIRSTDSFFKWMGLHAYPEEEGRGAYFVPFAGRTRPKERMGVGVLDVDGAEGMTFACAACHSSNLFGRPVLGMTNRFPRANELFVDAKAMMKVVDHRLFKWVSKATPSETRLYREMRDHMRSVEVKKPLALGLDTSLSQVALSLSRRASDAYASYDGDRAKNPDADALRDDPADSKPAVWWNVKYKNRWLSDGSIVSGNPIFTNILWNEVGRGGDLERVESWLKANSGFVRDLTTAVFASEAPRFTDFFSVDTEMLASAKRGEEHFEALCARCHGSYEKAWSQPGTEEAPAAEQMRTLKVYYSSKTQVIDVGTDPYRALGMRSLERRLNPLAFSRTNGIRIEAQKGYVPPPLEGIWARWPYFHNNSAPSLCAVLSRGPDRPETYLAGEANDRDRDFDRDCNGYPLGDRVPSDWQKEKARAFDSRRDGLGRLGHDEGIFVRDGKELLSAKEKRDLIRYLQTL